MLYPCWSMERKSYPSDLTDAEWEIIEPLIPPAKSGGRPREVAWSIPWGCC